MSAMVLALIWPCPPEAADAPVYMWLDGLMSWCTLGGGVLCGNDATSDCKFVSCRGGGGGWYCCVGIASRVAWFRSDAKRLKFQGGSLLSRS